MSHILGMIHHKHLLFFIGIITIIFVSGTLEIDHNVANKSQGYFVHRNIEQANEAGRLGYIKYEVNDYAEVFGINWGPHPGVRRIIRSGPEDFDDIGYISLLQLIAIAGKKITLTFIERMHNYAFVILAALLSFIISVVCKNILAGWISLILALILKANILSLVYGFPDSRTIVIIFPFLVISIIYGLNWLSVYLDKSWGRALVLLFGLLIGMMISIRSSEGMAAFCAILVSVIFLRVGRKQKAISVATLLLGCFLVTVVMPIIFALHRDIKTDEFNGDISLYLQTTGSHPAWHSIALGVGKYPNSLGMRYSDTACYDLVRSRYPDAMDSDRYFHGKGYFKAVRAIYFDYVMSHPLEYLKNLSKAYAELFYVIPYATSAGNLRWAYGYLPVKPGVRPYKRDLAPSSIWGLINLRYRYLKLSPLECGTFILAVLATILAMRLSLCGVFGSDNRNIFLSIGFYLFLLGTMRATVPCHGLSLIVCFWIFSIVSFSYISFVENEIRSLVYERLRAFSTICLNLLTSTVKVCRNLLTSITEVRRNLLPSIDVSPPWHKRLGLGTILVVFVLLSILGVWVLINSGKTEFNFSFSAKPIYNKDIENIPSKIAKTESKIAKLEPTVANIAKAKTESKIAKLEPTVANIAKMEDRIAELEPTVAKIAKTDDRIAELESTVANIAKMENRIAELESALHVAETETQNLARQLELSALKEMNVLEGFIYRQDGWGGSVEKNTQDVGLKEGKGSILLKPSSRGNSYLKLEVPNFKELRGHFVRFGVWIKSQNQTPDAIQIEVQDGETPTIVKSYDGGGNWQWLEIDAFVHREAKYLWLTCNIKHDATDAVYFDGLKFWAFKAQHSNLPR